MTTVLYSSEFISDLWPIDHPFNPPTPDLLGQAHEFVAVHPLHVERDPSGKVHCYVAPPLIYRDVSSIARPGVGSWVHEPDQPYDPNVPLWAHLAFVSMHYHFGERERLITAVLNEGDEPWVYLVRNMVLTPSGYAELRPDPLSSPETVVA